MSLMQLQNLLFCNERVIFSQWLSPEVVACDAYIFFLFFFCLLVIVRMCESFLFVSYFFEWQCICILKVLDRELCV